MPDGFPHTADWFFPAQLVSFCVTADAYADSVKFFWHYGFNFDWYFCYVIGAETGGGWGGSIPLTFFAMTEKLSPHFRRYVGLLLFSLIIRPFQLTPCSTVPLVKAVFRKQSTSSMSISLEYWTGATLSVLLHSDDE